MLNLLANKSSETLETEHYKLKKISNYEIEIEFSNKFDFKLEPITFDITKLSDKLYNVKLRENWINMDLFEDPDDKMLISRLLEKKLTPLEALVIYYFMTRTNKGAMYKSVINTNILEKVEDRNVSK